jgi:topoisomerase IA-like protein
MAKYSKKSQDMVESAMKRKNKGTLRSGRSGKKVTSREQAIAIGLSEAREKGAKVPAKKSSAKKTAKKSTVKNSASKKATAKKTAKKSATKKIVKKSSVKKTAKKTSM